MAYLVQSDIENIFGTANVVQWSQLDPDTPTVVDTTRVAAAISWASEEVENRFRGGYYAVPFVASSGSLPRTLVDWCATLAGLWLYRSRGNSGQSTDADAGRYGAMAESAYKSMDLYLGGQRRMNCAAAYPTARKPFVVESLPASQGGPGWAGNTWPGGGPPNG